MVDYASILEKIQKQRISRLTTQELLETGFTDYYIRKLMTLGELKRVERGVYEVVKSAQEEKARLFFNRFSRAVFKGDYQNAYDNLKLNYQYKTTHDHDNQLRVYFVLLETLLDLNYESEHLENLLCFSEKHTNGYYEELILFQKSVISHRFNAALNHLSQYLKIEKSRNISHHLSTLLFWKLTNAVYFEKIKGNNQKKEIIEDVEVPTTHYYEDFIQFYHDADYEQAIQSIDSAISSCEKHSDMETISTMLKDYLTMNEELVICNENARFADAVSSKDYLRAYQLTKLSSSSIKENSPIYFVVDLLTKIYEKNESLIFERKKNEEVQEAKRQEELALNQQQSYQNVLSLVQEHNYSFALIKIEEYSKNYEEPQEFTILKKLMRQYQNLVEKRQITKGSFVYASNPGDIFKRFFESIRNYDYESSLHYSNLIQERFISQGKDPIVFSLYDVVLRDLAEQYQIACLEEEKQKEKENIQKQLEHFVYEVPTKALSIDELKNILNQKLEVASPEEILYLQQALAFIDMLSMVQKGQIRESDFEVFSYTTSWPSNMMEALRNGDYVSAKKIAFSSDWNIKQIEPSLRIYFTLYRKLFHLLELSFANQIPTISISHEEKTAKPEPNSFAKIYTHVKRSRYLKAYEMYLMNQYHFSKDGQVSMDLWLRTLAMEQRNYQHGMMSQFQKSYESGDYQTAKFALRELEDFAPRTGIVPNYDYLHQRIKVKESDIWSEDYVKRMQLYSWGKYYFQIQDYEKCINTMNEYILMDQDRTSKGYYLRGCAFEYLKQYERAKEDYEHAISIIPEVTYSRRLACVQMAMHDYKGALQTLFRAEERDPYDENIAYLIMKAYRYLDEEEVKKEYRKKYRALKKMDC